MLTRTTLTVVMVLGLLLASPLARAGDPPVVCGDGSAPNPVTRTCLVRAGGASAAPGGTPKPAGPAVAAADPVACQFQGQVIPCSSGGAWWSPGAQCYISAQPGVWDPSHAVWQGRYPEGMVYLCANPYSRFNYSFWSLTQPAGPEAPADPAELAQRAVASMSFRAITIGMVPLEGTAPDGTPYMGLVGLPTWMWVAQPSVETVGPQTRSVSAGGVSVTATASLQRVLWDMGDGRGDASLVSCGTGTEYRDSYGARDSPTCGYRYRQQGTYVVTATSHWSVAWSGAGQTGTIHLKFVASRPVVIGEVQVLTTR